MTVICFHDYIACQTRDGNLEELFKHENHSCTPSIVQLGKLRQGKNSDHLECLTAYYETTSDIPDEIPDVIVLAGAVVVNMIKPITCQTCEDYSVKVLLPAACSCYSG